MANSAHHSSHTPLYPAEFRPCAPADLVRIGAEYDGGYVLSKRIVSASRGLLSFGLSDEWEFERQFSRVNGIPVACFDPHVNFTFWMRKFLAGVGRGMARFDRYQFLRGFRFIDYYRFFNGQQHRHIRTAIGYEGAHAVDLPDAIWIASLEEPLFLKVDIEGWEYRILPDIVRLRQSFTGLAIEFHDVDLHERRIVDFIDAVDDVQALIHLHANSHTAVGPGGSAIVIEMSFMNRSLLAPNEALIHRELPIAGLDAPNRAGEEEIAAAFRDA